LNLSIPNPEPSRQEVFGVGIPLAVFGEKIAVGSFTDDSFDGRIWVFDRVSGSVLFTLENPDPHRPPPQNLPDWFGWSVAANEEIIIVGSREDDKSGVDGSGTAYVFDSNSGALLHTVFSPQPESNGEFGRSVAVTSDGNILVGAWGTSVNGIEGAGRAYLFDGGTGDLLLDIPNPEPQEFALFGWSVAAVGNRLAVGAINGVSGEVPSTGSVYVFASVPEPSTAVLTGALVVVYWLSMYGFSPIARIFYGPHSRRLFLCVTSQTS
jgi:hypothetical protein